MKLRAFLGILLLASLSAGPALAQYEGGGSSTSTTAAEPAPPGGERPMVGRIVTITADQFAPKTLTVRPGTTIRWYNREGEDHTVTADDGSFDSETIRPGGAYAYTFRKVGEFPYHCRFHGKAGGQGMAGTVTVSSEAPIDLTGLEPGDRIFAQEMLRLVGTVDRFGGGAATGLVFLHLDEGGSLIVPSTHAFATLEGDPVAVAVLQPGARVALDLDLLDGATVIARGPDAPLAAGQDILVLGTMDGVVWIAPPQLARAEVEVVSRGPGFEDERSPAER